MEASCVVDKVRLTVTNGRDAQKRRLIKAAALQLRDCHGNAAQVRSSPLLHG